MVATPRTTRIYFIIKKILPHLRMKSTRNAQPCAALKSSKRVCEKSAESLRKQKMATSISTISSGDRSCVLSMFSTHRATHPLPVNKILYYISMRNGVSQEVITIADRKRVLNHMYSIYLCLLAMLHPKLRTVTLHQLIIPVSQHTASRIMPITWHNSAMPWTLHHTDLDNVK